MCLESIPTETFTLLLCRVKKMISIIYPTVAFVRCEKVFKNADVIFHFSVTYRHPPFNVSQYSQYQFFRYKTITDQREKGKTFD